MYNEYVIYDYVRIKICSDVLKCFFNNRQASISNHESGGILLGRVFDKFILIEKATTPGKEDKHGLFFFHRNKRRAQSLVNKAFEETEGKLIYVGEWHTHRQKAPLPSFIDKFEIRRAFKKSKLNLEFIIFIIVGNDNKLGNLWVGCYDGKAIDHAKPLVTSRSFTK